MDLYREASDKDKTKEVRNVFMDIYWPYEQEILKGLAAEVLEELEEEKDGLFAMFDGIFEVDEELNVTAIADDTQEEVVKTPQELPRTDSPDPPAPPEDAEDVDQEEEQHRLYVKDRQNFNTVKKTASVLRKVHGYFKEFLYEERDVLDIPPKKLASLMSSFVIGVKKTLPKGVDEASATDAQRYHQPETLTSYYTGVARYCRENGYPVNLIADDTFALFRQVLYTRKAELKDMGLGNLPNQAVPMTDEDVEVCWETGAFGASTPRTLQNTLYFYLSNAFGWRTTQEQYKCEMKDLWMVGIGTPDEHLHFNEKQTKTRKGSGPPRILNPNMWLTDDVERCPVRMYKLYLRHRTPAQLLPSCKLFQTPKYKCSWEMPFPYKESNMSSSSIGHIMVEVKETAGLFDKAIKGSSCRKTMVTNLLQNGVDPLLVAQISGHRNVNSVNRYGKASIPQQRHMCSILVGGKRVGSADTGPLAKRRAEAAAGSARQLATVQFQDDMDDQEMAAMSDVPEMPVDVAPVPAPVPAPVQATLQAPVQVQAIVQAPIQGQGAMQVHQQAPMAHHQQMIAGMFSGATIQGSVNVHIHYGNVASSARTNTQLNVSPQIPHVEIAEDLTS